MNTSDPESGAATGSGAPAGDRRVVTVLFADLSGFTSLGESLDPEELTDLLRDCLGALNEEISMREGWLEKQIGDALLAVFGAPVAHEDDPVRAVRAALAMRARMSALNARLEQRVGVPVALHIGVNTGLVVMSGGLESAGASRPADLVVVGDTVNTAARLQQAAGPGQIFVGASTYAATSWAFEYRALAPLPVKGKKDPLAAYECLSERERTSRGSANAGGRLVGRDPELAALRASVDRVLAGRGGLALVSGEAGLGKSRLVAEARHDLEPGLPRWLEGHALSLTLSMRHWPFLELLRSWAGIGEGDSGAVGWTQLERSIGTLGGDDAAELEEIGLYVGVLLGLPIEGDRAERVRYLDADRLNVQIFRACRRLIERLAGERPLVLALEDWHWADDASQQLLEHLLPLTRSLPLLVVCTMRPVPEGPAARLLEVAVGDYADRLTQIPLAPLSTTASAELVRDAVGLDELPRRVRDAIFERAEGNPFFLEEIVRALIDLGVVARDGEGRWAVVEGVDQVRIPDTVRGVIVARIDRLDEELKELLRVASVFGRSFLDPLLRAIVDHDRDVDAQLQELELLQLVQKRRETPELEYVFRHALTQEAVYDSILIKRRRELHRAVAGVLERLLEDRGEELHGLLAFHYARAEDWEHAERHLLAAGDQAGRVAADAEALSFYEDALAAHARTGADRWSPLDRARLERKIGEALFRRGKNAEALEHLRSALALLGASFPDSRAGIRPSLTTGAAAQVAWLLVPRRSAHRAGGDVEPIADEIAHTLRMLSWIVLFTDPERYFLASLRLARHARQSRHAPGAAVASSQLGVVWDALERPGLAVRYHRRAVSIAEGLDDPVVLAQAHLGMGTHELFANADWRKAHEHLQRSTEASWRAGDLRGWGLATALLGIGLGMAGEIARNEELARDLIRTGEEGGDDQLRSWGLVQFGVAQVMRGDLSAGADYLEQGLELLASVFDPSTQMAAAAWLARCELRRGRRDVAESLLDDAEQVATERRLRGFFLTDLRQTRVEVALNVAEEAGERDRGAALARARRACQALLDHGKSERLLLARAYCLRGTYEWLAGSERGARRWWQQSLDYAERVGTHHTRAETQLEIANRTGDPARLAAAREALAEMGVEPGHREAPAAAGMASR